MSEEGGCPPCLKPAAWTAAPTSSWDACGGKTLSSSKDTCFPLCRRCRTASSSASKVTALVASGPSPSSFVMGRTRPKTRMFPWRRGHRDRVGPGTSCCHSPGHYQTPGGPNTVPYLMGMWITQATQDAGVQWGDAPLSFLRPPGTYSPTMGPATLLTHLSAAPAHCDTSCGAVAPAGTCAAAPGWCCAPPRWPGRSGAGEGDQWFSDTPSIPTPHGGEPAWGS